MTETPSITFIAGWGFKSSILTSIKNMLPKQWHFIFIEYPEISENDDLFIVTSKIQTQIPDNSIIIGWSFGGVIASALAYYFPNKCKKTITICSSPCFMKTEDSPGKTTQEMKKLIEVDIDEQIKNIDNDR